MSDKEAPAQGAAQLRTAAVPSERQSAPEESAPSQIVGCPKCGAIYSMMEIGGITDWGCSNSFHSRGRAETSAGESAGTEPQEHPALVALKQWELDTDRPSSAIEGNAFIDGFNAAVAEKETEIALLKAALDRISQSRREYDKSSRYRAPIYHVRNEGPDR